MPPSDTPPVTPTGDVPERPAPVPPELAVLVGLQASGKSTFRAHAFPEDSTVVCKDLFPRSARHRQRRQMRMVTEALERGRSVVVDNTNPSPLEWAPLIAAGRAHGARVVAYWFPPDVPNALARNAARQGRERVPEVGFFDTLRRLRRPRRADGFDVVWEVRFDGRGGFDVRPGDPDGADGGDGRWDDGDDGDGGGAGEDRDGGGR